MPVLLVMDRALLTAESPGRGRIYYCEVTALTFVKKIATQEIVRVCT